MHIVAVRDNVGRLVTTVSGPGDSAGGRAYELMEDIVYGIPRL